MATDTRPGFRLPWPAGGAESDDQSATGDAPVAEESNEPDMVDNADIDEGPAQHDPPAESDGARDRPARRASKFMAELSRAMQAAAENARAETMARFRLEAKGVADEVHASATDEAASLRRQADDDVAAIREWSKAEIARVREEAEARIAARKSGLDGEMGKHAAMIEARVERVAAVVAAFEAQMAAFFEHLNAEEDPTRIATMAEAMPEPPSLADIAASITSTPPPSPAQVEPLPERPASAEADDAPPEADFAAAEAEAASFSGDLGSEDDGPTDEAEGVQTEMIEDSAPQADVEVEAIANADLSSTQVIVSGLVSVANIANFKRSLARTSGVSTIAVASGPDGDFVFTVGHTLGTALSASVVAMPGFDVQITGESETAINVAAQDRDATD